MWQIDNNSPIISITQPSVDNINFSSNTITVGGTISDEDNDAIKVLVLIEGSNDIQFEDIEFDDNKFSGRLNLITLVSGSYNIIAQGFDAKGDESKQVKRKIIFNNFGLFITSPSLRLYFQQ